MFSKQRGESILIQAGDDACQVYEEETHAANKTPLQGRGDAITLLYPEGPYMETHGTIRRELNPSGGLGEWIDDAALHNPRPHLTRLTGGRSR